MNHKFLFESPEAFDDFHRVESLYFMCMDARFEIHSQMFKKHLGRGGYDRQILAGGIIGLFAEEYGIPSPGEFLLFSADFAVKYHGVKEVILVEHDDCGAYKSGLAFKLNKSRDQVTAEDIKSEQEKNLPRARELILKIHPELKVLLVRCCLEGGRVKFYEYS